MPEDAPPQLSVVMPAHNEAALLEESVRHVVAALGCRPDAFELVVVENGSSDGTLRIAERLAEELGPVRALSALRADYGAALRTGILAARADVVATFDVDYVDLAFLEAAVPLVDAGAAIVVASKRGPGADDTRPWPRRLVTATFATLLRVGFGLGVSDTHGMKVLRRGPLLELVEGARFGTDLFDTELVIKAERAGLGVTELPVHTEERRPSRTPIVRRAARTLVGLVRLRLSLR